jgi:hypothetical protein
MHEDDLGSFFLFLSYFFEEEPMINAAPTAIHVIHATIEPTVPHILLVPSYATATFLPSFPLFSDSLFFCSIYFLSLSIFSIII